MMRKKNTPARRKTSIRESAIPAKFRRDAAIIVNAVFGEDGTTPPFVRDLWHEYLSELESESQIGYWSDRRIAQVALPLMLQELDRQGVDYFAERNPVANDAFGNLHGRAQDLNPFTAASAARASLFAEYEQDAEAVARILNSPRLPEQIKQPLADAIKALVPHPPADAATLRIALPLALRAAEKAGAEKAGAQ
jgi:hypothetical protein